MKYHMIAPLLPWMSSTVNVNHRKNVRINRINRTKILGIFE